MNVYAIKPELAVVAKLSKSRLKERQQSMTVKDWGK